MRRSPLLLVDAAINLLLGGLLIAFPRGLVEALGVPDAEPAFYARILGGVLLGIGLALLIERGRGRGGSAVGLGLAGAVAINACGGVVLAGWLLFGGLDLPLRGAVSLWSLAVLLLGLVVVEIRAAARRGP